jgi:hypothetical protein
MINIKLMSKQTGEKRQWGGPRRGAGRPVGKTKVKKCISVNQAVWQSALVLWSGKGSPLVENLLADYVKNAGGNNQAEAI